MVSSSRDVLGTPLAHPETGPERFATWVVDGAASASTSAAAPGERGLTFRIVTAGAPRVRYGVFSCHDASVRRLRRRFTSAARCEADCRSCGQHSDGGRVHEPSIAGKPRTLSPKLEDARDLVPVHARCVTRARYSRQLTSPRDSSARRASAAPDVPAPKFQCCSHDGLFRCIFQLALC